MKQQNVTLTDLIAYASGELNGQDAVMVEAYLAVLPEAARANRRLQEVIDTLRTDDTQEPSAEAVLRALRTLRPDQSAPLPDWLGPIRVLARLVFDSRNQPALAGYRGGASSCQVAYECDAVRLDLQIIQIMPQGDPSDSTWRLRGQVTARDDAGVDSVSLLRQRTGTIVAAVVPDDVGRFKLMSGPGVYDLQIELDQGTRTVLAPGLEVGPDFD